MERAEFGGAVDVQPLNDVCRARQLCVAGVTGPALLSAAALVRGMNVKCYLLCEVLCEV